MPSRLEGGEIPVQFEAVTALALLWFAREKCDLVVLETGLGGRCDATNIVPNKLVAAITKIGHRPHRRSSVIRWTRSPPKKPVSSKKAAPLSITPSSPPRPWAPSWVPRPRRTPVIITPDNGRHAACCAASAWKTASTTAVTKPACSCPVPIRPTTPLWLWRSPSPSGGSSATTSPTMPLSRALSSAHMPARIEVHAPPSAVAAGRLP